MPSPIRSLVDSLAGDLLGAYLADAIKLRDFQEDFTPIAWSLGNEPARFHPLSRAIELRLAEYSNGHWTEDQLRAFLLTLATGTYRTNGLRLRSDSQWRDGPFSVPDRIESASSKR